MDENELTEKVIGAAIEVHRTIGPGLLESIYEECMSLEMASLHVPFERQRMLPIRYRGIQLNASYRMDFFVGRKVVVDLKAVEHLVPVHEAQLLTYLRLTGCTVGLLINFNVAVLKHGIRRMVNHFPDSASPRLCGGA
jgi:GxxExxY protein